MIVDKESDQYFLGRAYDRFASDMEAVSMYWTYASVI